MSDHNEPIATEIRGVLIPLYNNQLLLPNAAVAEVIDYRQPDAVSDAPEWLMGGINWRQRNLMVIRLESLLGQSVGENAVRQRIVVCHSLSEDAKRPFVGIVTSAIPRLVRVREASLEAKAASISEDMPIHSEVMIEGEAAMIPDLSAIEKLLAEAA